MWLGYDIAQEDYRVVGSSGYCAIATPPSSLPNHPEEHILWSLVPSMYPNLPYLSEDTWQDFLGWWFKLLTSWKWSGLKKNLEKDNLQSEFTKLWTYSFIFSDSCFFQKLAAHRMNIFALWLSAEKVQAMQFPSMIFDIFLHTVLPLKSWNLRCFLGCSFYCLRFFSQYSQLFHVFFLIFCQVFWVLPMPRQVSAFLPRFLKKPKRGACQRQAKSGGRRSHHPGSLQCHGGYMVVDEWLMMAGGG